MKFEINSILLFKGYAKYTKTKLNVTGSPKIVINTVAGMTIYARVPQKARD